MKFIMQCRYCFNQIRNINLMFRITETAMGYSEDFQSEETLTKLKDNTAK